MFSWGFNCLRCAASKMTTVATRRIGSGSENTYPHEEDDKSRRSEDGEDDSGMVCDDVSGHMVPSSSSSRSSLSSNDGRFQESQSKSEERLNRTGNSRKVRKSSGRRSDQSLSGRDGGGEVFGSSGSDGSRGNKKAKTWGPVNVIVQHNQDGTVTAKAVTPTEYTERDFTTYVAHRAPKSLSMNDIGSVSRRNFNQNESRDMDADDEDHFDDVDGVFHVRRMIRDNSLELFSLPECRAEPVDNDCESSGKNWSDSDEKQCDAEMNIRKGKTFKPLMIFPGGENIPERDYDTLKRKDNNEKHDQEETARITGVDNGNIQEQSMMASSGYVGMSQENNVTYHHSDRHGHIGMPRERVGPIREIEGQRNKKTDDNLDGEKRELEVQGRNDLKPTDLPDSMKNADMHESLTGPTASKVEEELKGYEPPEYQRLIPELGISEGSVAAGDNVLLELNQGEKLIMEENILVTRTAEETRYRGFKVPKESRIDSDRTPWETNLRVGIVVDIITKYFQREINTNENRKNF